MRRFILVLTVGAMMAALLVLTASHALADHRDRDFDSFGQDFDQEAESGDVDISFESTNAGDNSNVTAPALQFANTGNLQNAQGFSSFGGGFDDDGFVFFEDDDFFDDDFFDDDFFDDDNDFFFDDGFGSGGDVEFEGASMEFSPSMDVDSDQAVQQSSAASSWWW